MMIIIVTIYATDISIIKEIKGDVKNQPYEDTDLEHGGSWVRIPSGAQIFLCPCMVDSLHLPLFPV